MSPVLAVIGGWGMARWAARHLPGRWPLVAGIGVGLLLWRPVAALSVGSLVGAWMVRSRILERRRRTGEAETDLALLGELVLMGLTAGLSLQGSLELAAAELRPVLAGEVRGLLREARRGGLALALGRGEGRARSLYLRLARAQLTGAPIAQAVVSFVGEQRDAERTRLLEEARRLPIRMVVPLALLILPGFALLTVGPSILASLQRLADPFWSTLPPVVGRPPT